MVAERAWAFASANRSLMIVIPISALLLASVSWNIWQYRLDRDRLRRRKPRNVQPRRLSPFPRNMPIARSSRDKPETRNRTPEFSSSIKRFTI